MREGLIEDEDHLNTGDSSTVKSLLRRNPRLSTGWLSSFFSQFSI